MLLVVWFIGATVGYHHFDHTDSIEEGTFPVLIGIVSANIGDADPLPVVKFNVHLIAGLGKLVALHLERDSLGLDDIDRFQSVMVVSVPNKLG